MTLLLVNVLPARRARDLLMLASLLFAAAIVLTLRFIQPERLMRVENLPDVTDFFATLQSPITPLLPSFWAGEVLFAGLQGAGDLLHGAALWTTALAFTVMLAAADRRWHFAGYSRSQESPKARVTSLRVVDALAHALPLSTVRRQLLVKDVKVFLRDVSQWLQLLPLFALVLLYLYNFRALDLERIPYMSGVIKNVYALVNLGMAGFVVATVAVRFVFPAVSAEGAAFWLVRTSPVSMRDFLWSKFWTGLVPMVLFTEVLTVAANELMGVDPFLKVVAAVAVVFMILIAMVFGALGTGIGSTLQDRQGFQLIMNFMVLPIFFLSGALFPLANLPTPLAVVTRLDPLAYGVDGLRAILLGASYFGAPLDLAVLLVVAGVFVVAGARQFSRIQI
jgi:ABC-2 type transport system permease protein